MFSFWSIIFFIPKKSRIRFTPITIFTTFLVFLLVHIGQHYKFWAVKGDRKVFTWNSLSIMLGFLPIGNFIICHFFFGKFKLYLLANFILNFLYAFYGIPIFDKLNLIRYVKFNKYFHILTTMSFAVLGYGYQLFLEKNNFMKGKKLVKWLAFFICKVYQCQTILVSHYQINFFYNLKNNSTLTSNRIARIPLKFFGTATHQS